MERDFYQTLRKIQREERKKSTLARVGNDFYKRMYAYIKELEHSIQNNPFSNEEHNLLKNSQIIATEICQLRETKINEFAVRNIQRSYFLFRKDKPQFDLVDSTPLNLTDEEETLYFSIMDTLKKHRSRISLDKFAEENNELYSDDSDDEDDSDVKNGSSSVVDNSKNDDITLFSDESADNQYNQEEVTVFSADEEDYYDYSQEDPSVLFGNPDDEFNFNQNSENDEMNEISDRLNQIQNAKVITDEKFEPIEKQIANQRASGSQKEFNSSQKDTLSLSQTQDIASSQKEVNSQGSVNVGKLYKDEFANLEDIEKNYHEDFNQVNADFDRINDDLDKLSSQIPKRQRQEKIALVISDSVGSIMGVDEKVYGPFAPQDFVILPKLNGEVLIKNEKARLVDIE